MVQIGAGQAEGALVPVQGDLGMRTQVFPALPAGGFAGRDEKLEFFRWVVFCSHDEF